MEKHYCFLLPFQELKPLSCLSKKMKGGQYLGNGLHSFRKMTSRCVSQVCSSTVGHLNLRTVGSAGLGEPGCRAAGASASKDVQLAASLVSTHQMPGAHPTPSCDNQKCIQTLPKVWGQNSAPLLLPLENHCSTAFKCGINAEKPANDRHLESEGKLEITQHVVSPGAAHATPTPAHTTILYQKKL